MTELFAKRLTAIEARRAKLAEWAEDDVRGMIRDVNLAHMIHSQVVTEKDLRGWAAMMDEAVADIQWLLAALADAEARVRQEPGLALSIQHDPT